MRWIIAMLYLLPAIAQHRIRVDSPGDQRSYIVNLDDRKTLGRLSSASGALPGWLTIPGSSPSVRQMDGKISATFQVAGAVADTANYYRQLLTSQGYALKPGSAHRVTELISGSLGESFVTVSLRQLLESVEVRITAPAAKMALPAAANLEAVSYDDATGVLLLRDKTSNIQYQLDREAIRNSATGQAAAKPVVSRIPDFVPIYPNGRIDKSQAPSKNPSSVELRILTNDTSDQAMAWYKRALAGAGFQATGLSKFGSGGSFYSGITVVDASGTHAVGVSVSPNIQMASLVCDKSNDINSPFAAIGKCTMSSPEKTVVSLKYQRLQ